MTGQPFLYMAQDFRKGISFVHCGLKTRCENPIEELNFIFWRSSGDAELKFHEALFLWNFSDNH